MKQELKYEVFHLQDDGVFPNSHLPALLYKHVLELPDASPADHIIQLFHDNDWRNSWKNGIYDYHHYHSNTHEVLAAYEGNTVVLLGGDNGEKILFEKGDVLIIPAGVAHKNLTPENNFSCVGAYPDGKNYNMNYGKKEERDNSLSRILSVPLPLKDPVFGPYGELLNLWEENNKQTPRG